METLIHHHAFRTIPGFWDSKIIIQELEEMLDDLENNRYHMDNDTIELTDQFLESDKIHFFFRKKYENLCSEISDACRNFKPAF